MWMKDGRMLKMTYCKGSTTNALHMDMGKQDKLLDIFLNVDQECAVAAMRAQVCFLFLGIALALA